MTDGGASFASGLASAGLVESAFATATLGSGFASFRRGVVSSFFSSSFDVLRLGGGTEDELRRAAARAISLPAPRLPVRGVDGRRAGRLKGGRAPFTTRRDRGCQGSPTRSYRVPLASHRQWWAEHGD